LTQSHQFFSDVLQSSPPVSITTNHLTLSPSSLHSTCPKHQVFWAFYPSGALSLQRRCLSKSSSSFAGNSVVRNVNIDVVLYDGDIIFCYIAYFTNVQVLCVLRIKEMYKMTKNWTSCRRKLIKWR